MPLTQSQKARQDLARKRAKKATPDLAKLSLEQKKRQQVTWDPLGTWSLAWKQVFKTWIKEKQADAAFKEQQRIFKLRQACEAKGWTFNTVTEQCSMWIQEDLAESVSFRWQRVSKEQEALNLIARWDIEQVEWMDISWIEDPTALLSTLAWARKQEEEKTELEKKLEKTKADARRKLELKKKAIEAAWPWIERGAEAPTVALARWVEWILTERAAIIHEEFTANQQAITEQQTALDEALRTWRVELVRQARWAMLDLRKQELNLKAQATTDVIETMWDTLLGKSEDELAQIALDQNIDLWLLKLQQEKLQLADKTAEAKTKIATTKASDTKVTDALNTWLLTWWTSEQLTSFAEWSSYTPWELSLLAKQKEEIMNMKDDDPLLAEKKRKYNAEISWIEAKTKVELEKIDFDDFVPWQTRSVQPTWEIISKTFAWRKVTLDSWAMTAFSLANNLATEWGIWEIKIWGVATSSTRDQSATIAWMISRWNWQHPEDQIEFDQSTPNNSAAALRARWIAVANVGSSKHENWLALDIFPDQEYIAKVKPFLEDAWWKQTLPVWDAWHFEFVWLTQVDKWTKQWTYKAALNLAREQWLSKDAAIAFAEKRFDETFKWLTDFQGKAFNAFTTMNEENKLFDSIISWVTDTEDFADAINYISQKIKDTESPMTQEIINRATENVEVRRAILSEVRWIEAALREESWAAINVWEYLNKGTANFPRAWDDEKSLQDKKKARETATKGKFVKMWPSWQRQWEEAFWETAEKVINPWRWTNNTSGRWQQSNNKKEW